MCKPHHIMNLRPSIFTLHLVGLWLLVVCLAGITFITLLATFVRSDCRAVPSLNITAVTDAGSTSSCSTAELISNTVLQNLSYLHGIHTIAFQLAITASLLVFQPALRALVWSSLEGKTLSLRSLHNRIQLSSSPGLIPGITDAWNAGRLVSNTALVIILGVSSLVIPVAVSPIYHVRVGALRGAHINITMGGGIGPGLGTVFNADPLTPGGVVSGRALINSATITGTGLNSFSYSPAVIPFLDFTQIPKIAYATIETVAVYTSVDCGPSAPDRFLSPGYIGTLVNLSSEYWNTTVGPYSIASGEFIGSILNDPVVSVLHTNATTTPPDPVWTNSTSSVILLAANGTLEGAQQHIPAPPGAQTRINNIDVLVCTSTASLGISSCLVTDGRIRMCTPLTAAEALSSARRMPQRA
jgi:hypothetical protein